MSRLQPYNGENINGLTTGDEARPDIRAISGWLAQEIANKTGERYGKIISIIRSTLSFLILGSCSMCIHSHKKVKDSLETRAVRLIFLLELEISGVAVPNIHQNNKTMVTFVRNCQEK